MALSSETTPTKHTEKDEKARGTTQASDGDTDPRAEGQSQVDNVAMVSRTATGEPHQNPGYQVIGLPEDATEEQKAAAENRPESVAKSAVSKSAKA